MTAAERARRGAPDRFLVDGDRVPSTTRFSAVSASGCRVRCACSRPCASGTATFLGTLFAPAIKLASEGFTLAAPASAAPLAGCSRLAPRRATTSSARRAAPGQPLLLRNPVHADPATHRRGRADTFFTGAMAQGIVDAIQQAPNRHGHHAGRSHRLSRERARPRLHRLSPAARLWHGTAARRRRVAPVLKLLEPFDIGQTPVDARERGSPALVAEAEKLAYADRDQYLDDPDPCPRPPGLLDATYPAGTA